MKLPIHRIQDDIQPTHWERFVAPSLRLWANLEKNQSVPISKWRELRNSFDAALPSSEGRIRIAISVLAIVTLALIGLTTVIGGSLTLMGRIVSMDPTDAPRWVEILMVAAAAFLTGWYLKGNIELRRRVEWQSHVFRQIEESVQLLSSSQDTHHE